jgi:hypothetical protein
MAIDISEEIINRDSLEKECKNGKESGERFE